LWLPSGYGHCGRRRSQVAAVAAIVALRYGAHRGQALLGAICASGVVGLAVGDLSIDRAGEYWAKHPMFGAGIVGLLLVGLTVLIVNAVIEQAENRRWRRVVTDRCMHSSGS
jgi:hypothetical protein